MSSSPFPVFYEKLKDGSNKKIISFSIYGEKPLYYLGAELNIKEAKEIYPGWICRFYCTKDVPNLEKLKELDCEVIVPDLPSPPIYWRILACDDPNVDVCIQRDSDSVVNSREKVAVDEWINSDKTLHFMHDCSQGHFHKIMAGMWGIKKTDKFDFTEELISFFKSKNYASIDQDNLEGGWGSGRATYFDDQNFLSEIMYNCFSDDYMEHGQENDFPPHEPLKYGGFVGDRVFASEVLVDDNFLDKDEIFIQSHLSIDDQMPLNGMIRHLHETGKKIIFAVRESNLNLIKYCLSDLDNLEFKILVGDEDGVDSYAKDYDLSKTSLLALGNYGRQIHNVSDLIDKCYMQANLPVEYKSSKFFIPEDIEGDTQLKPQELEILNKYKSNLLPAETIEEISLKIDPSISKEPFAAFVLNENGEVNLDKILQRPKSTHGFLIDGLRELSEKYIKPNSTIVEIGCYMGESAEIFLESGNVDKIYCVDPWENNYDSSDESSHKAPMEFVEKSFDDRVSRFGDKVVKLKMTAERAFELIADESVDLVYLDGEHTYEANERYLNLYNPKLKHDGYMCGHDWGFGEPGGTGHSQTEAIRRFFKSEPIDIFQDNSWVYDKFSWEDQINKFNIQKNKTRIAFHTNEIGVRGSEWATYKYAHYNERILNNESIYIAGPTTSQFERPESHKVFSERFKVFRYNEWSEVDEILKIEDIDILYMHKGGHNDGKFSTNVKTCVHSVFQMCDPHGDRYAYISEWLSKVMGGGKHPFVPYMVEEFSDIGNLRLELKIPEDAIVLGRLGGPDQFDIDYVHEAIRNILNERDDIYFLFGFTNEFVSHPRVIHYPPFCDDVFKSRFISTCDGMIHARTMGESFGLAIAEFSAANKPVITLNGGNDQAHLDMLGDTALYYNNYDEVFNIFKTFDKNLLSKNWDVYSERFSPELVMSKFKEVFIDA
jgi:predicted O-methyltransferase YrrM